MISHEHGPPRIVGRLFVTAPFQGRRPAPDRTVKPNPAWYGPPSARRGWPARVDWPSRDDGTGSGGPIPIWQEVPDGVGCRGTYTLREYLARELLAAIADRTAAIRAHTSFGPGPWPAGPSPVAVGRPKRRPETFAVLISPDPPWISPATFASLIVGALTLTGGVPRPGGSWGTPMGLEDRIIEARRGRCLERLIRMGQSRPNAEQWCEAWELEAERRGWPRSREYWEHGQLWIDAQIQKTLRPRDVLVPR